ncbi:4968_t:CDS:2, partial [Gigaspora rosea]
RYKEACEDLTGLIRSLIKEGEEDLADLIRLLTKEKEDLTDLIRSRIKKKDLAVEMYDESKSDLYDLLKVKYALLKVKPDDAWAEEILELLEE